MLARQRHREILARLDTEGGVRVAALARSMGVAEETIRRDLDRLGGEGRLIRTHGGAVPILANHHDLPFDVRRTAHLPQKEAIALAAVRHVNEGDVIALDASSTVHELTRVLPDMPLTVVTNSIPVTLALANHTRVQVISTGGTLDDRSLSFTGSLVEQALERFHISKLFLSSKGVDLERGLSEVSDDQALVKRQLLDAAEKVYLLVDHSKLGVRSVVLYSPLDEVDIVISDEGAASGILDDLDNMGLATEIAGLQG